MPEYGYVSDELGVPGQAVIIMTISREDLCREGNAILNDLKRECGSNFKLKNVPEGPKKQRLREVLNALGCEVAF
jgi:hypothetical protein